VAAAWIGAGRLSRALGMPGRAPWIYAATVFSPFIAIHAFALFDHDFPFAYISDVNPWYVETPTTTGRYILTVTTIRTGIEEAAPGFERPIRVDKGR
jgi:hypothetical protein